jgi:hypothetical protein
VKGAQIPPRLQAMHTKIIGAQIKSLECPYPPDLWEPLQIIARKVQMAYVLQSRKVDGELAEADLTKPRAHVVYAHQFHAPAGEPQAWQPLAH